MGQIRVVLNDAPIHCLDVLDSRGERLLRVRPDERGAMFTISDRIHCASVAADELREFADALTKIADMPRARVSLTEPEGQ